MGGSCGWWCIAVAQPERVAFWIGVCFSLAESERFRVRESQPVTQPERKRERELQPEP
jgi:hypothetical protein